MLRTAGALLSVQGVTWLSSLINVAVLPRYLGAEHFGFTATAWTAVAMVSLVAGFGTGNMVIKETAREPGAARSLAVHAAMLQGLLWLVITAVVGPIILLTVDSGVFVAVLGISALAGLATLGQSTALAALQGLERLGRTALLLGLLSLAGNLLAFGVLWLGGGVISVSVTGAVMAVAALALTWVMFLSLTSGRLRPEPGILRSMFRAGPPYLAWDLGQKVYASVDLLLLSILAGASSVGAYAFAYRLIGIPVFATTIITMSVYPSLSAAAGSDEAWFRQVVSNSARLCMVVTAPAAVGIAVLAPQFVDLLAGGGFSSANVLVVILALHIPPAAVHTIFGMALFARDQQRRMAMLAWVASAVNIVANLIMIPLGARWWGDGAIGAALVTLFTEVAMGALVWRWSWQFIDRKAVVGGILRAGAATAVMAAVVIAANSAGGLLLAIAAGVLSYGVAVTLLGAVSVGELREMLAQTRRSRPTDASHGEIASANA